MGKPFASDKELDIGKNFRNRLCLTCRTSTFWASAHRMDGLKPSGYADMGFRTHELKLVAT
jgi:hypothetical protein